MNRLALIAMALASATAFLGVQQGCGDSGGSGGKSSSTKKGGSQNTAGSEGTSDETGGSAKGGSNSGASGSTTSSSKGGAAGASGATGGKGGTGASGATGGKGGTGGTGGTGGATGGTGDSITLQNGLYSQAEFSGYTYTANDGTSTISPPCGEDDTGAAKECFTDKACVKGTVAKIPKFADGGYDYDNVWGALFGWNLSVKGDADSTNPGVSIDSFTKISVQLKGATLPASSNLRLQMEVPNDSGKSDSYCIAIKPDTDGKATVEIAKFKTKCWASDGEAWKSGLKPKNLAVQMYASNAKEIPFDYCVAELKFE